MNREGFIGISLRITPFLLAPVARSKREEMAVFACYIGMVTP